MSEDPSLLARVVQSSLEGIHANAAIRDAEGKIVDFRCLCINPAGSRIVNAPPDWLGRTLLECFPQAKESGLFDRTVQVVETGRDDTFEYPLKGVDQERWVRLALSKQGDGVTAIITDITQDVAIRDELRRSHQQFEVHLARMPLAAMEWDLEFRIRTWNPAAENMFGWTAREAIGQHASFIIPPAWHGQIHEVWANLLQQTGGLRNTNENLTKSGETILCEWHNTPLVDSEGRVTGVASLTQDVTQRRQVELELSRTNRALKMLSSCNATLIREEKEQALLDEVCRIAVEIGGYRMAWVGYAQDDAACTIKPMAVAGEEAGYLTEGIFSWSDQRPEGRGMAGCAIRSGRAVHSADVTLDASFAPWQEAAEKRGYRSVICLPLHDKDRVFGILGLYSGSVLQITPDEVLLLQELADNLSFGLAYQRADFHVREQASLLDKAQDAIFVRGLNGIITYWNKGAERLYGWKASETVGRSVSEFLYEDRRVFDELNEQAIEFGDFTREVDHLRKNGSPVKIETRTTLLRDAQGRPKSILAINTDITERKKLESQILRVQRMESIGTLAGGIAHDLNNVLAPILMSVKLLGEKITDAEGRALLSTLTTSSQRGADLIRQVLSFARGVEGKRMIVYPRELVHDIQRIIRDTFPKNISFECHSTGELWTLLGDSTQLHQVLMNLCVNARDAMPAGGKLTVNLSNIVLDEMFVGANPEAVIGPYVLIGVADSGIGIPREACDKIFEPFFTTKQIGHGTGLGLSTTLGIVKSHGGFIKFETEENCGTTFSVYLPTGLGATLNDTNTVKPDLAPRGRDELVLLVDDEESIRTVGQAILKDFGYRVLTAENGSEAVDLYRGRGSEIALVITDMTMPVKDGLMTILELKALDPGVKIIASSGLQPTPASGGWTSDVQAFISKPYTAETLLQIVRQVIDERAPVE